MRILFFIGSVLDRLCAVAGAFIGSQIPQFMQQYIQRLAGHVESLEKLLQQLREMASFSNKNLEQYIQKFRESSDPDFVYQADFMQGILNRWQELYQTLNHLTQSPSFFRPYYFFKDFQADIIHSSLNSFQPGFNLTIEGLCYTAGGMILGWIFCHILFKCILWGNSRALVIFKQSV